MGISLSWQRRRWWRPARPGCGSAARRGLPASAASRL